jgi:hypothetical protein
VLWAVFLLGDDGVLLWRSTWALEAKRNCVGSCGLGLSTCAGILWAYPLAMNRTGSSQRYSAGCSACEIITGTQN